MNFTKIILFFCLIVTVVATRIRKEDTATVRHSHLKRTTRGWFSRRNRGVSERQMLKMQRLIREQSYRKLVGDFEKGFKIEKFSHFHKRQ